MQCLSIASSIAGPEVTAELTRLSAENARLRTDLSEARNESEIEHQAEVQRLWRKLLQVEQRLSYRYTSRGEWHEASTDLGRSFYFLSASLASEVEIHDAAKTLAMELREGRKTKEWDIVAVNQVTDMFADLMALGLVEPSKKKHAVADTGDYWSLTDLGHEVQKHVRVTVIESGLTERKKKQEAAAKKAPAKKAPAKKAPAKETT